MQRDFAIPFRRCSYTCPFFFLAGFTSAKNPNHSNFKKFFIKDAWIKSETGKQNRKELKSPRKGKRKLRKAMHAVLCLRITTKASSLSPSLKQEAHPLHIMLHAQWLTSFGIYRPKAQFRVFSPESSTVVSFVTLKFRSRHFFWSIVFALNPAHKMPLLWSYIIRHQTGSDSRAEYVKKKKAWCWTQLAVFCSLIDSPSYSLAA